MRAAEYQSTRPINGQVNGIDAIESGSQVLIDILLLAKCGHFLHAESSVATLASFFNPHMELHFLGNVGDNGTFKAVSKQNSRRGLFRRYLKFLQFFEAIYCVHIVANYERRF